MHFVPHLAQLIAAQAATSTATDDLGGLVHTTLEAFQSKNWTLLAGAVLMLLTVLARRLNLIAKLPVQYIPWAAGGTAMLAAVALGLMDGQPWTNILATGLSVGLTAVGAWKAFGKPASKLLAKTPPKSDGS